VFYVELRLVLVTLALAWVLVKNFVIGKLYVDFTVNYYNNLMINVSN